MPCWSVLLIKDKQAAGATFEDAENPGKVFRLAPGLLPRRRRYNFLQRAMGLGNCPTWVRRIAVCLRLPE
jgi:hypothetical protein